MPSRQAGARARGEYISSLSVYRLLRLKNKPVYNIYIYENVIQVRTHTHTGRKSFLYAICVYICI